ncbi:hypothetical protein B0T11DRAFT_282515 [Plectosphaerella cucumerina]|uniref:Apple domain-containing protein n=1 Tax=Plectosphaerella cucumerina TaxID=40658 RepID=A0A8K0TG62_9PEZI|nr:hypothetical protein B0T11DRAFT_282515 [Plectosphaerella cucumerina]
MRFTASLALSLAIAAGVMADGHHHDSHDIFPDTQRYEDWAICRGQISRDRFPTLAAPDDEGGCVRYFRGIDITGVVTEQHFFFRDGFENACDCAAKCLEDAETCTNWVWKHTFMDGDDGKRSCTLYSSPNLPAGVTLEYNLNKSTGFMPLQAANNPQAGAPAPLTFLDVNNTMPDMFGVSGFTMEDQNGRLFC